MKTVINSKYKENVSYIERIPNGVERDGEVIRDQRNVLHKVEVDDKKWVVKRYKRPNSFNRWMYTFFRRSKARRSYEYALRLQEAGFGTADPVAYIEIKRKGLFHTGYFVSEYLPCSLLKEVDSYDEPERNRILDAFACHTAAMHEKGIVHYDYNPENIFFYEENGEFRFAMIDINRMRFKKPSRRKAVRSLKSLGLAMPSLVRVTERYAIERGLNPELISGAVLVKRSMHWKHKFKQDIKSLFRRFEEPWEEPRRKWVEKGSVVR